MKSNEEVERLLNENSEINNSKINEMRDLMEKYQTEKRELEEKHSQSVRQLEVRSFSLISLWTISYNSYISSIVLLDMVPLVHFILFYGLNLIWFDIFV